MTADASGPPEAGALAPVPLLLEADGEAVVPQPVTRIRVSPMAPRVERGRCIRPPPGSTHDGYDWWLVVVAPVATTGFGVLPAAASSGSATGAPPHPLGRAGRARVGRASSAGPRRWTLNSNVSATYDSTEKRTGSPSAVASTCSR